MKRRSAVLASLALGSLPIPARTQQPGKVWRIGVLSLFVPPEPAMQQTIVRMLAPFGYEQDRNLIIDYQFAQGRADQLPALAAQLLAAKPDLLIGPLNDEIKVLKQATTTIPIVMMYVAAPVETGLINSLARPGGNLTGTTTSTFEGAGKMMQVFKETVPSMSRVSWVADPDFPGMDQYGKHVEQVGAALGVRVTGIAVRTAADLDAMLGAMERERPDGIMAGRNGWQIDKILKGAKPGEIPVEEPAKFRLVVNMKTARAMGLVIPTSMLLRADDVIQ